MKNTINDLSAMAGTYTRDHLVMGLDRNLVDPIGQMKRALGIDIWEDLRELNSVRDAAKPAIDHIDELQRFHDHSGLGIAETASGQLDAFRIQQETTTAHLADSFRCNLPDLSNAETACLKAADFAKMNALPHSGIDALADLHGWPDGLTGHLGGQLAREVPDWLAAEARRTHIVRGLASGDWMNLDLSTVNHAATALANMQNTLNDLSMTEMSKWKALHDARMGIDVWLATHVDDDADAVARDEVANPVSDDPTSDTATTLETMFPAAFEVLALFHDLPKKVEALARSIAPWERKNRATGHPWGDASPYLIRIVSHHPEPSRQLTKLFQRAWVAYDQFFLAPSGSTRIGVEELFEEDWVLARNILLDLQEALDEIK